MKTRLGVWIPLMAATIVCAGDGRLEISRATFPVTLTNSGSYLLTENLTGVAGSNGITIAVSDVVIDLNGMTLAGVSGSLSGIAVPAARSNLVLRNGTLRQWSQHGIDAARAVNSRFSGLTVIGNGGAGLWVGPAGTVQDCKAEANGGAGLDVDAGSTVAGCTARVNTNAGLRARGDCTIRDCVARENGSHGFEVSNNCAIAHCASRDNDGHGITAGSGCLVRDCVTHGNVTGVRVTGEGGLVVDCTALYNSDHGVDAGSRSTVRDCVTLLNLDDGIRVTNYCVAAGNTCSSNSTGLRVTGRFCRLEGNHLAGNQTGLLAASSNNLAARNTAAGNVVANYSLAAGNHFLIITNPGTNLSVSSWANFSY